MAKKRKLGVITISPITAYKGALIALLLKGNINDLIQCLCRLFLGHEIEAIEKIIMLIGVIIFLGFIPYLIKNNHQFVIGSLLLFVFLWTVSYIRIPANKKYLLNSLSQFYFYVLPFLWIGGYCINNELYLVDFIKLGRIKLALGIITQMIILAFPVSDIFGGDYMDAANALLVGLICVLYLALKDRKPSDVVMSLIGVFLILINGSRNVFAAVVVFILLYFIIGPMKQKWSIIFFASIIGIVMFAFYDTILGVFVSLTNQLGLSAHLLDALINRTFFSDSSRQTLASFFIQTANQNPVFGYGVLGDRFLSVRYLITNKEFGIYPHNLFIELFVDFGYILGGILIIDLLRRLIIKFTSPNIEYRMCVLILFSCSFIKLMFSSTFWNDQMFFLLIGFLISKSRKDNYEENRYSNISS